MEENPFNENEIAKQWIRSVEGEIGLIRDNESYPILHDWYETCNKGTLLDIGCGQGICSTKVGGYNSYIGIDPSQHLIERANLMYESYNRQFKVGNAYNILVSDGICNSAISLNVWFHLADIDKASKELCRVLKSGGKFWIHTVNSDEVATWLSLYINLEIDKNKAIGEAIVPVNNLSRNTYYFHTNEQVIEALEKYGLVVNKIKKLGEIKGKNVFVVFEGHKA